MKASIEILADLVRLNSEKIDRLMEKIDELEEEFKSNNLSLDDKFEIIWRRKNEGN